MKNYVLIVFLLFCLHHCFAQNLAYTPLDTSDPVHFGGSYLIYQADTIWLGPKAFFIDGQLTNEEADHWPFVFNSVQSAAGHLTDGTEADPMKLYLAPYVYWIDDPDDPDIRVPKDGPVPYGMEISCEWLSFIGLNRYPENVVLAGNRGQTLGAKGNFTLFRFQGDGTSATNVTFGNYCNVDLEFPLLPALNRTRRADAIVQAQLIHCDGDKIMARNTRFISRLNLCPFVGGKRVFFDQCHFECTDDALCGTAVYKNSTLDFYSSKPFYHTPGTGAVFLNCDIRSFTNGKQYFTKANGQLAVVDTRIYGPDVSYLGWRDEPPASTRNYQHQVSLNGDMVKIGAQHPASTVELTQHHALSAYKVVTENGIVYNTFNLLRGEDDWDPEGIKGLLAKAERASGQNLHQVPVQLSISANKATLETGKNQLRLEAELFRFGNYAMVPDTVSWKVESGDADVLQLAPSQGGRYVTITPDNASDYPKTVILVASTPSGLEAACEVEVLPEVLPAPELLASPDVETSQRGMLEIQYDLENTGYEDQSEISWYRCSGADGSGAIKVAVSRKNKPLKSYSLSHGDVGYYIMASIRPKHLRSDLGDAVSTMTAKTIQASEVTADPKLMETDFRNMAIDNQPRIIPGFWSFYPSHDSIAHKSPPKGDAWYYGKGSEGSKDKMGLLQTGRSAGMSYTPWGASHGDMSLRMTLTPFKTAGQGFSVAPLYMDILIKYDARTGTGYGLRLVRTTEYANSIACFLVEYTNFDVKIISEKVFTSCFRNRSTVDLAIEDGILTAHLESTLPYDHTVYPAEVKASVDVKVAVASNDFGGIGVEYNGGSTTMINHVKAVWK